MTRAVYLLGGPGVGKSTLMAYLLRDWKKEPYGRLTDRELFGHELVRGQEHGMYLGHLRDFYPGTDALSLSVAPQARLWVEFLMPHKLDWVFGEGTRLGNIGFLSVLAEYTDLHVFHLMLDPAKAALRRETRGGKLLTDKFCKMVTSGAASTAAACREAGIWVSNIDASLPVEELASVTQLM